MWSLRRSKKPEISATQFTEELVQSTRQTPPTTPEAPAAVADQLRTVALGTKLPGIAPFQAGPPPRQKYVACMVTHGMGQQVPFETVGLIAEALGTVAFQANRVRLTEEGELLSRLECAYTAPDGTQVQVHLYEGYWAPLTEGKISFWETIGFLYSGGLAGLRSLLRRAEGTKFSRWMFGDIRDSRSNQALLPIFCSRCLSSPAACWPMRVCSTCSLIFRAPLPRDLLSFSRTFCISRASGFNSPGIM